jgi:hypothetical protein
MRPKDVKSTVLPKVLHYTLKICLGMIHMLHRYRTMSYFLGTLKYFSQDSTLKILMTRPTKDTLLYNFDVGENFFCQIINSKSYKQVTCLQILIGLIINVINTIKDVGLV